MADTGASEIDSLREYLDGRFGRIDDRFGQMDERFDRMDDRFDQVDRRLDHQDQELQQIKVTVGGIKMETAALIDTVADMNRRTGA